MATWSYTCKSEAFRNNRIDAERYKPVYLLNENTLLNAKFSRLKDHIKEISGGATPKGAKYNNNGVPFIRVQNIRDNYLDLSDIVYIDHTTHEGQLFRSQLKNRDVLLTITGVSYGNSAVVYPVNVPANMNQHSVRIALKETLVPEFLSTFLICKYGKLQSDSKITGDTRPALTYNEISNYIIPTLSIQEQVRISTLVQESFNQSIISKNLYIEACKLLEEELGLNTIDLLKHKSYLTNVNDVISVNRIDAEYFNPMLRSLYLRIKDKTKEKLKTLPELGTILKFGNPPYTSVGSPIITQKHLSKISPEISDSDLSTTDQWLQKNPDAVLRINDLLFYSVGAYLGKTNIWLNKEKAVPASFITLIRCRKPEDAGFLFVLLNSRYGILQSKVFQSGTSQPYIYPKDLKRFLIPTISESVKTEVYSLITSSFACEVESKHLLVKAKNEVEALIEQSVKIS